MEDIFDGRGLAAPVFQVEGPATWPIEGKGGMGGTGGVGKARRGVMGGVMVVMVPLSLPVSVGEGRAPS